MSPKPKEPQALACATPRVPGLCCRVGEDVLADFSDGLLAPGRALRVHYYGVEFAQLPTAPRWGLSERSDHDFLCFIRP